MRNILPLPAKDCPRTEAAWKRCELIVDEGKIKGFDAVPLYAVSAAMERELADYEAVRRWAACELEALRLELEQATADPATQAFLLRAAKAENAALREALGAARADALECAAAATSAGLPRSWAGDFEAIARRCDVPAPTDHGRRESVDTPQPGGTL
jgi:hypothetical protein